MPKTSEVDCNAQQNLTNYNIILRNNGHTLRKSVKLIMIIRLKQISEMRYQFFKIANTLWSTMGQGQRSLYASVTKLSY